MVVKKGRKRTRKRNKSKFVRRNRARVNQGFSFNRRYPWPTQMRQTLRYMEQWRAANPGVGGISSDYVFSLNGLYDPNITGTGHQPIGFDQLMTFYDHYNVRVARGSVYFKSNDSVYTNNIALKIHDDATSITDANTSIENGYANMKIMKTIAAEDSPIYRIDYEVDVHKWLGRSVRDPQTRGDAGNNPTEQLYLHVLVWPNESVDSTGGEFFVLMEFDAVFTEPQDLSAS